MNVEIVIDIKEVVVIEYKGNIVPSCMNLHIYKVEKTFHVSIIFVQKLILT